MYIGLDMIIQIYTTESYTSLSENNFTKTKLSDFSPFNL